MKEPMKLVMNPSIQKVAEFMQSELQPDELIGVAKALAVLAPSLWARHAESEVYPLWLRHESIDETLRRQSTAI